MVGLHPLVQGIHMAVEVLVGGWIIILASHIGVTGKELLQLGSFLWGGLGDRKMSASTFLRIYTCSTLKERRISLIYALFHS